MGSSLIIPEIHKSRRVEMILTPEVDLADLIGEYLGDEIKGIFEELMDELYDYREQEQEENG